jgi:DNA-binding transcriptional ArsR family regulator
VVKSELLDRAFAALADPTRRALMVSLTRGERSVGDLAAPFPISLVAVSKHLGVLEQAGLITRRRVGRIRVCALVPDSLAEASAWIERHRTFWNERLDGLDSFLTSEDPT